MRGSAPWTFVGVTILLALPVLAVVLRTDQFALHGSINAHHAPWADAFFRVWTWMGSGWVPTALALALLFKSWRAFLMMALSAGLSALMVQGAKHFFFADHDRPAQFAAVIPGLYLVPGEEMNHHYSFPSGHSTAAFSMCLALAVIIGHRAASVVLAMVAASLAFSRVYLSQHFTEDVLAGAALGTLTGIAVYGLVYRVWANNARLDRSPFRRTS